MEYDVATFGRTIFEELAAKKSTKDPVMDKIRDKVMPYIYQLIRESGLKVVNYFDESGNKILPSVERIRITQEKLWGALARDCEVGDLFWTIGGWYNGSATNITGHPYEVIAKTGIGIIYEARNLEKVPLDSKVIRAPKDWERESVRYSDNDYWLRWADKLGI